MTAPSPAAAGLPAEDVERVTRAIGERAAAWQVPLGKWIVEDFAAAALAEMRPTAEAACGHLSPVLYVGEGQPLAPLMCELPYGHGGAHEARNGDLPPTRWAAAQDGGAEETLRDALRVHHPIMRSETGPFSGCRCGQVKLGQDVIGHVTDHLRAALAPVPDDADGGERR